MNINRNNYEECFILYLDNELDSESRREVEAFAEANPDLKTELDMLLQSKLVPDTAISFSDKDSLMRFHNSSISLANYEEWLIAYIDNELSPEERKDAENFIAGNPSIQRELNLLQRTKLQPEAIAFPYKESLYRKEEKARVIAISWRRIAIAAVLLLAISTTAIVLIRNNKSNSVDGSVVTNKPGDKKSGNNTAIKPQKDITTPVSPETTNDNDEKKIKPGNRESNSLIANKPNKIRPEEQKEKTEPVKEELLVQNNEKKPSNIPEEIKNNSNPANKTDSRSPIASVVDEPALTKNDGKSKEDNVTTNPPKTSINEIGSVKQNKNPDAKFASNSSSNGHKGGVRGFLRKVTRTFEKRTNIKATDDDDRLLIAGLAIKL